MINTTVTLDVRDDIRQGKQPCSKILEAVAWLKQGETLKLVAPFEPVPLFDLLARKGFSHRAAPIGNGDWEVHFSRNSPQPADESVRSVASESACGCGATVEVVELDARGLEPPQPMVKILEALEHLPCGTTLRALTDRQPMHLLAQLEQRGFSAEPEERADGSFFTTIRRG